MLNYDKDNADYPTWKAALIKLLKAAEIDNGNWEGFVMQDYDNPEIEKYIITDYENGEYVSDVAYRDIDETSETGCGHKDVYQLLKTLSIAEISNMLNGACDEGYIREVLNSFADLLKADQTTETGERLAKVVYKTAEKMQTIINEN